MAEDHSRGGYCHCHHWRQRSATAARSVHAHHDAIVDAMNRGDGPAAARHQHARKEWEYRSRWTRAAAARFRDDGDGTPSAAIATWLIAAVAVDELQTCDDADWSALDALDWTHAHDPPPDDSHRLAVTLTVAPSAPPAVTRVSAAAA